MIYEQHIHKRKFDVDGVEYLTWIEHDTGAWEGPKEDWISSHKEKYTKYCKKTEVAVTAGGNMGMYPLLLSKIFTTAIYTFEPEPMNFHCLVNNCQSEKIIKIQAALGDKHQMIKMNIVDFNNCGMHRVSNETGYIPMLMLDDFQFETLDFVQLDSEGFEFNILNGAINTINKHQPVISAENGHTDQIINLMNTLGYVKVDQSVSDSIYIPKEQ